MIKVKEIFYLIVVVGLAIQTQAQDHFNYISARFNQGYVLIHSRELRPIKNSYPVGLELDFGRHKTSQKVWNNCNCYPKTGVTVTFWDFDNREVLGYGITSMFYVQPVFGAKNKLSFSVRGAMGLSYQSKPFDEETNPDNLSYSTSIAFPLQLGVATHYKFAPKWEVDLNVVYNHISNGGMKEPNKGINWPTIGLGVSRYFREPVFPDRVKTDWRKEEQDLERYDFTIFGTYQQPRSKFFLFLGGVEFKYAKRVGRLNNLTAGAEWLYDSGQANLSADDQQINGNNLGMAMGNEFILGKFLFGQQFAVYLMKPETQAADVYQRYSLVYRITPGISAGVSLKSHGHVADFADIRVGYSF